MRAAEMVENSPVFDDAVVEKDTSDDLDHLADRAVSANDRLFDTCSLVDLGGITDDGIG
jgi:hypothetical protein